MFKRLFRLHRTTIRKWHRDVCDCPTTHVGILQPHTVQIRRFSLSRRAKESETWKLVSNLTRDWPNLISPTRWLSCVVWASCRRVLVLARGRAMLFRIFFLSASLLAIALAISTSNPFLSRAKLLRKHGYHRWVQFRPPACALSFTPASGIKWHIANTPKSQLVQPSTQKYESHVGLSWNSTWDIIKNMH